MARPLRLEVAGATYHVTARGNRRAGIFLDELDYVRFLGYLADEVRLREWEVLAYCLMPNHLHVLLTLVHENLSAGVQRLNSRYAMSLNRRYCLTGHTFEGRFRAKFVLEEPHFLQTVRYIAMNPVVARLCPAPLEWPWSSHRAVVLAEPAPVPLANGRLLAMFGRDAGHARVALDAFVRSGLELARSG